MFKNLKSIAGAAIILATLATTTAQAKQVETDTPKTETVASQKVAKASSGAVLLAGARRRLLISLASISAQCLQRYSPPGSRRAAFVCVQLRPSQIVI